MKKQEYIDKYGEEWYLAYLERNKIYRLNHKKEIAKQQHEKWERDKEKLKEYYKKYRIENAEKIKEKAKNNPISRANNLISGYNQDDRDYNRGKGDLTSEWIIENIFKNPICHYCGKKLDWKTIGVDRKDSSLPHTKENCVPCCIHCNSKKRSIPYDEYIKKER